MTASSINGLSDNFNMLINSVMTYEHQPIDRMTQQKDQITLHRAAYLDMKTNLSNLQDAVHSLMLGNAYSNLALARSVSVTPALPNTTVATATAASTAIAGTYELSVTQLAKAERYASADPNSIGYTPYKAGTLWLGGTNNPAASVTGDIDGVLAAGGATVSDVAAGLRELSSGSYQVETRVLDGVTQFRVVDADGKAVQIADQSKTDNTLTDGWQAKQLGAYDTKRGLTLNFTEGDGEAAAVSFTARGTGITIETGDSMITIANKINDAKQPLGHDAMASVVGNRLILTAASTGDQHQITMFDDGVGLGLGITQVARNAKFSVNGIDMERQANTGLTDVVAGVTFNLAADAESTDGPRTATIVIKPDNSSARKAVDNFITKINTANDYIVGKTAIEKTGENTYTRGALAEDNTFSDLRGKMLDLIMSESSNSGAFKFLNQIGLSLDANLKITISDSTKYDAALDSHFDDTTALLTSVMTKFDSILSDYTGSKGYVQTVVTSDDNDTKSLVENIKSEEVRLAERNDALVTQYGQLQAMLQSMSYQNQMMTSIAQSMSAYY
jgi:flagellar hook-associated protein 2